MDLAERDINARSFLKGEAWRFPEKFALIPLL
jgi:hypothetical protein